jgi:hypothetical protein
MSDIQIRLADINASASKAAVERDRQFIIVIAYIWIVTICIGIAFYSLPQADHQTHLNDLDNQENVHVVYR